MDNEQLRKVMRYYLDHFNSSGRDITDRTKHQDILSSSGSPNTKDLYEGSVRYSLKASGNDEPEWPDDWMALTVAELANELVPTAVAAALRAGTVPARAKRLARAAPSAAAPVWLKQLLGHKRGPAARKRAGPKAKRARKPARGRSRDVGARRSPTGRRR
jgi:hypothetical protein